MVSLPLFWALSMIVAPLHGAGPHSSTREYLVGAAPATGAQDASAAASRKIPSNVMTALITKFPQARIDKWTRETEDGNELYDIEFTQAGRKYEADISAAGTIQNWERQVAESDLPQPVLQAVTQRFPKSGLKEIMAVTAVTNGVERLEGYEIVVHRSLRRDVEITIAPDGRVLEGPGKEP
jgi:hypothetical protein